MHGFYGFYAWQRNGTCNLALGLHGLASILCSIIIFIVALCSIIAFFISRVRSFINKFLAPKHQQKTVKKHELKSNTFINQFINENVIN